MLLPIALVLLCSWNSIDGQFSDDLMLGFYLSLDLIFDHFVFGGTLTKRSGGMSLLQSAENGLGYYKNVLLGDQARRGMVPLLMMLCHSAIVYFCRGGRMKIFVGQSIRIEAGLFRVFLCFSIGNLALLLARRATYIWVNMLIAYGAAILFVICNYFLLIPKIETSPVLLCLGLFLSLFTGRLLYRQGMKKRKESYYYEKRA